MTDTAEYFQLQKSRQQLKKVKQLLTQQPHNENLLSLKTDLEEVIEVTQQLLIKKRENAQTSTKPSTKSSTNTNHSSNTPQNTTTTNTNDTNMNNNNNNESTSVKNVSQKQIPREWGIRKDNYEVNERCQVHHTPNYKKLHFQET